MNHETGIDRITRARSQMQSMVLMFQMYLEALHSGETDQLPPEMLINYVWQLEQNLEAIDLGLKEAQEGGEV
ncbi:hypothetical protein CK501_05665 [Halovibrio salipaludis]|uniref:Uncharacterized protein n=1 Tax=Halovibrio salipaludis TaxID=2032626 RepID=A0A2A2F8A1_9GAMM|nr:hypothetical protein [Halovibrio salipaludis]PAU81050.1 hypothetical protein CK501_05665 [Halovibrio salipaludis]